MVRQRHYKSVRGECVTRSDPTIAGLFVLCICNVQAAIVQGPDEKGLVSDVLGLVDTVFAEQAVDGRPSCRPAAME